MGRYQLGTLFSECKHPQSTIPESAITPNHLFLQQQYIWGVFLRRLINLTIGVQCSQHHIRITSEARADLSSWLDFSTSFNGVTLLLKQIWVTSDNINLYTDASGSIGYAAVMGSYWFQERGRIYGDNFT